LIGSPIIALRPLNTAEARRREQMPSVAFLNGQYVPLSEAKVGIMTHALHYGTAVFEGIRGNWNTDHGRLYIYKLREHYERMMQGCKLL